LHCELPPSFRLPRTFFLPYLVLFSSFMAIGITSLFTPSFRVPFFFVQFPSPCTLLITLFIYLFQGVSLHSLFFLLCFISSLQTRGIRILSIRCLCGVLSLLSFVSSKFSSVLRSPPNLRSPLHPYFLFFWTDYRLLYILFSPFFFHFFAFAFEPPEIFCLLSARNLCVTVLSLTLSVFTRVFSLFRFFLTLLA